MNTRDNLQQQALNSWVVNKGIGTIEAVTGFGKSRVGCLAVEMVTKKALEEDREPRILILTPTTALRDQVWPEEFVKSGVKSSYVEFECIHTAKKFVGETYDLVIADEIHMMLSSLNKKFFHRNSYTYLMGLSATIDRTKVSDFCPVVFTFTLQDAIKHKIISPFYIYNIPVEFTLEEKELYRRASQAFRQGFELAANNLERLFDNIKNPVAVKYTALSLNISEKDVKSISARAVQGLRKRKDIIYKAENKINAVYKILKSKSPDKAVIFTESIDFLESIYEKIVDEYVVFMYHSKMTGKERKKQLEAFKNAAKGILVAVKALNTGINIPECDTAIIASGTSVTIDFIQRMGRVLRKVENKEASVYQLIIPNSQEVKWVINRLSTTPKEFIRYLNTLDELDNEN